MHYLESRVLGSILGVELRAAAFALYWRRREVCPDFAGISKKTGISLDALGKAWEIVRTENNEQSRGDHASV